MSLLSSYEKRRPYLFSWLTILFSHKKVSSYTQKLFEVYHFILLHIVNLYMLLPGYSFFYKRKICYNDQSTMNIDSSSKKSTQKFVIMWSINNENENFEQTYLRCKSFFSYERKFVIRTLKISSSCLKLSTTSSAIGKENRDKIIKRRRMWCIKIFRSRVDDSCKIKIKVEENRQNEIKIMITKLLLPLTWQAKFFC